LHITKQVINTQNHEFGTQTELEINGCLRAVSGSGANPGAYSGYEREDGCQTRTVAVNIPTAQSRTAEKGVKKPNNAETKKAGKNI
jgi:hypothetical protein